MHRRNQKIPKFPKFSETAEFRKKSKNHLGRLKNLRFAAAGVRRSKQFRGISRVSRNSPNFEGTARISREQPEFRGNSPNFEETQEQLCIEEFQEFRGNNLNFEGPARISRSSPRISRVSRDPSQSPPAASSRLKKLQPEKIQRQLENGEISAIFSGDRRFFAIRQCLALREKLSKL